MQIVIKTITDKTISIEFEKGDTCRQVKQKIAKKESVPVNTLRLIFAKRLMTDTDVIPEDACHEGILHVLPSVHKDLMPKINTPLQTITDVINAEIDFNTPDDGNADELAELLTNLDALLHKLTNLMVLPCPTTQENTLLNILLLHLNQRARHVTPQISDHALLTHVKQMVEQRINAIFNPDAFIETAYETLSPDFIFHLSTTSRQTRLEFGQLSTEDYWNQFARDQQLTFLADFKPMVIPVQNENSFFNAHNSYQTLHQEFQQFLSLETKELRSIYGDLSTLEYWNQISADDQNALEERFKMQSERQNFNIQG